MVDVRAAVEADVDHEVTVAELRVWETDHGQIPAGAAVLLTLRVPFLPMVFTAALVAALARQL